jgi:hypothetical protein
MNEDDNSDTDVEIAMLYETSESHTELRCMSLQPPVIEGADY